MNELNKAILNNLNPDTAKEVLDNLVQPLYSSLYNPKEIEKIFNTK